MIVLGTDLGSALFRAKLAIAKQAEREGLARLHRAQDPRNVERVASMTRKSTGGFKTNDRTVRINSLGL